MTKFVHVEKYKKKKNWIGRFERPSFISYQSFPKRKCILVEPNRIEIIENIELFKNILKCIFYVKYYKIILFLW